jgi:hypothetical protein
LGITVAMRTAPTAAILPLLGLPLDSLIELNEISARQKERTNVAHRWLQDK